MDEDRERALSAELGESTVCTHADVAREADVAGVIDVAVTTFGRVDCVFNNAGLVGRWELMEESTVDEWRQSSSQRARQPCLSC